MATTLISGTERAIEKPAKLEPPTSPKLDKNQFNPYRAPKLRDTFSP